MRAKEFIKEGHYAEKAIDPRHEAAISGLKMFPDLDQYYDIYRFGLAMAAQPDANPLGAKHGAIENNPTTISYTDAEEEIIMRAAKRMGMEYKQLSNRGSFEPDDTHKVSPVANLGPVKRKGK
jgi:hypothetical protein